MDTPSPDGLAADVVRECSHHVPGVPPALAMGENARACAACIAAAIQADRWRNVPSDDAAIAAIDGWVTAERQLRDALQAWRDTPEAVDSPKWAVLRSKALAAFELSLAATCKARVALQGGV